MSGKWRVQALRTRRAEHGTTVVEVTVVLLLLGIVMATFYAGLFGAARTVSGTEERLRNLAEARVIVAVASKDLRTAVRLSGGSSPFVVADDNEVVFYANLDTTGAPKKVRVHVDANDQLVEEVWTADAGSVAPNFTYSGSPAVRFVGQYVANGPSSPIFTFYDDNGTVLGPTPLAGTNLLGIDAVGITFKVKRTSAFNDAYTTVVNRVRLPNVDYNAVAGG